MARPSTLTAELLAAIASSPAPNSARMLAELNAAGFPISGRTLRRHLASTGHQPMPLHMAPPPRIAVERRALAALESGDDLSELRASAREVAAARAAWTPHIGAEPSAVRAFATLARLGAELTRAITELAPAPQADPEHDPAHVAAKARLLAMVEEVLSRDT